MHGAANQRPFAGASPAENANTLATKALVALEDAVLRAAEEKGITPEAERRWERYQKIKALALAPGCPGEAAAALRAALVEAVRLAF